MRYKGYVVTYAGELLKINKENYFLNGICREETERPDIYDVNKDFGRRNLYAVSSGVKCDVDGDKLSLIAADRMKGYYGVDFAKEYRSYFGAVNSEINSHILEKGEGHYEVDTSVLYIENDIATVYNFGDMPVFYFEKGKLEKISGNAPKTVEIEKNVYDNREELHTKVIEKKNIPYLGVFGEEYETVPYVSQGIKLKKKSFFVLCSKSVCDVVGEKTIEKILADNQLKDKDKAVQIVDIAVGNKPDGNYTVQVVQVDRGIPVTNTDLKSVGAWIGIALLCAALYFTSSYIMKAVAGIVDASKSFVESYVGKDIEPDGDLKWTPRDTKEDEQPSEKPEEDEPNAEQGNVDASVNHVTTAPQTSSTPRLQKPATSPQKPTTSSQKPVEQETPEQKPEVAPEPKPQVELPGTTAQPETSDDVELPIDFN